MKQIVQKSKYIIQEEGITTFIDRAIKNVIVRGKRRILNSSEDFLRWSELKNKYKGQRAFLIGNGPSLNKLPLYLLRNEYAIGFNRVYLLKERLNWLPGFYTTIDDRVLLDSIDEIKENLPNFKSVFLPDLHPYNINFRRKFTESEKLYWLYLDKLEFSNNLPYAGINKSVANVGLQILAYFGFSPIYIIGVDLEYKVHSSVVKNSKRDLTSTQDDDPNHFDPRYFGAGRAYHNPRMEETFLRFKQAKLFFDKLGIKIHNAGIGGKLDAFPRVNYSDLFDYSDEEKKKLFLESFDISYCEKDLTKIFNDLPVIDSFNKWDNEAAVIAVKQELGIKLINKVIFTHIPKGPFDGIYYFFKRENSTN